MDGSSGQVAEIPAAAEKQRSPKRPMLRSRRWILMLAMPALILAVAMAWMLLTAGHVSTDNAQISAARAPITSSVRARVSSVLVTENQKVKAGDELVRLDAEDFAIAATQAEARLAAARLQVDALRATYRKVAADFRTTLAAAEFARNELSRQENLFKVGLISQQDLDRARNASDIADRNVAAASEARANALASLGGDPAIDADKHPLVLQAKAALDQATSDLGDTAIRAPTDGVVTRVSQLQPGSYVQPAQTLFWIVSGKPWVDAAFKENQLQDLRIGQPVTIHVDAFPNARLSGHVASFSPGTGSSFAVLPAENASGNWVRVVQRLNVRIELDEAPADLPLAIGLMANVTVDTSGRQQVSTAAASDGQRP